MKAEAALQSARLFLAPKRVTAILLQGLERIMHTDTSALLTSKIQFFFFFSCDEIKMDAIVFSSLFLLAEWERKEPKRKRIKVNLE